MDRGGTSDPYLVLDVGPAKEKRRGKTRVVYKSLAPSWNETFEFRLTARELAKDWVTLRVFDKDLLSDDLIGETKLALKDMLAACLECQLPGAREVSSSEGHQDGIWFSVYDTSHAVAGQVLLFLSAVADERNENDPSEAQQEHVAAAQNLEGGEGVEDGTRNVELTEHDPVSTRQLPAQTKKEMIKRIWIRRVNNARFPVEQLQAAIRNVLTPNVQLHYTYLGKNALARIEQSAMKRMLVRRVFCQVYRAALVLETLLRARIVRNLYLTARVWCARRSGAGGGEDFSRVLWQLMGKSSARPYLRIQTAEQHGLWMAGAQQQRR